MRDPKTDPLEGKWFVFDEAVRGFLLMQHLPWDTVDDWADELVTIALEHLR